MPYSCISKNRFSGFRSVIYRPDQLSQFLFDFYLHMGINIHSVTFCSFQISGGMFPPPQMSLNCQKRQMPLAAKIFEYNQTFFDPPYRLEVQYKQRLLLVSALQTINLIDRGNQKALKSTFFARISKVLDVENFQAFNISSLTFTEKNKTMIQWIVVGQLALLQQFILSINAQKNLC